MFEQLSTATLTFALCSLPAFVEAAGNKKNKLPDVSEIACSENNVDEAAVRRKYELLTKSLICHKLTITTMESCTAGQLASLITDTEGSSAVLKGAFVTYSNEAKIMQGVPKEIIETYGVYSAETATAMALACRDAYAADFGVGITGSFGNTDPSNPDSIPGEVFFAISCSGRTECWHCNIPVQPSRLHYKLYMANAVAEQLLERIEKICTAVTSSFSSFMEGIFESKENTAR